MQPEHLSAEPLLRWRAACGLLNPKRLFRFTANTEERIEASNMRNTNQVNPFNETTPVRWISQDSSYVVPENFDEAGYAISADDAAFIVEGHNSEKLKLHGGVDGIAKKLKTCTTNGLAIDDDLTCRQQLYGTNEFTEPELRSFWVFMFEAFQDVSLMVLALCAFVLLIAGIAPVGWPTGPHGALGIVASTLLVVLVTAANDYFQSLQFWHLDKESKKISIQVTRNGCRKRLPISALLTGDIVHLAAGHQVPADGLFISGLSVSVDKSSLTGESEPVNVNTENPYLLSGSKVQNGACNMLVVTVGMRTQWGKLMATLTESGNNETPLQVRLNGLTTIIGKIGLIFAIMTFVVLVQKLFPTVVVDVSQWSWSADVAYKLLEYFSIAVATVVVAVPEGLSMAVTLSHAYATKMIGDKVLIRNPAALENIRSVTTICSDVTVRPGVKESMALCRSGGITVRLITRDNITTAKAVARRYGILTDDGIAIDGPDFCKKSPVELVNTIPRIQVLARASPQDKLTLVKYSKTTFGEVVVVTGDGANDAPALLEADIGLAMGITGTEVAKESADVIILDGDFSKIVTMVKWGRSVYANIQKFIQFQLTVNIVALTVNFTSACLTGSAPLTAVQLLWVNMIMDTLGALALVTEPPTDELMKRDPVGRKGSLISNVMWRNISGQALYQFAVIGLLQLKGKSFFSLDGDNSDLILNTLIFNSFVFCQLFNMVNSREMEKENVLNGLWKNKIFLSVIAATVFFQVIIVEYLGPFANTLPLTATQWLFSLSTGFLSMPVALLLKRIPENHLDFSNCLAGFIKGLQRFWSVFVCILWHVVISYL